MPYVKIIDSNNSITIKKYILSLIKFDLLLNKNRFGLFFGLLLFVTFLIQFLSCNFFNLDLLYLNNLGIWEYFLINYSAEFKNFTDIQSIGFLLYLTYPFITIILGIILWCVLIGILKISLA